MNIDEFQRLAQETDQRPGNEGDALIIPLLGLAGEAGTLLSEYKKQLRDGPAHKLFKERVAEELGDILWYVANVATKNDLSLETIAHKNIEKTRDRWVGESPAAVLFDDACEPHQQLPRSFAYIIAYREVNGAHKVVLLDPDDPTGQPVGDPLTDNAYEDDGYRFHDVLHLANAAVLGWSPVLRSLLKRKRKDMPKVDEVEDGGRAAVIEEAIAALVYEYAVRHNFLAGVERVDWDLLLTIKRLTANLEVRVRSEAEWERAILLGFRVWRAVRENNGGLVRGDLGARSLEFAPAPA
ncbi:MazG nucleotide pyrophosphohydrolase domain-containing protein [Sorangium sp. So ce302]|uniref:nucleoside triphosphate pyrophosphohydrolase family protein n=1 Tax=Sorangium sp. So ce302 TaxID=3133297 RepID=UPI003F62CAFF